MAASVARIANAEGPPYVQIGREDVWGCSRTGWARMYAEASSESSSEYSSISHFSLRHVK